MEMNYITASTLFDFYQCPHLVWRDIYGPQEEKILEANPFIQLLWEKGVLHEEKVVKTIGNFLDLKEGSFDDRFQKTIEAINNKEQLIYQGIIRKEDLLGIPDLLELQADGSYILIDIKSGRGYEGTYNENEEGKLKEHYALQLCHYVNILMKLRIPTQKKGKIIDINNQIVEYDLVSNIAIKNPKSFWDVYEGALHEVYELINNRIQNKPAYSGKCKLCTWFYSCKKWCEETDDLTNIFYLGRNNRDKLNVDLNINTVDEIANLDVENAMKQKEHEKSIGNFEFLNRISENSLKKWKQRATVLNVTKKAILYGQISFPKVSYEVFYDIEDDPTQDFVYLHGVYERTANSERYIPFVANEINAAEEKKAWKDLWEYIDSLPYDDFAVYYYSQHEQTASFKLYEKYPEVVPDERLRTFFRNPHVIDLYQVIYKFTDWPLRSYSIKEIAQFLGFKWRDDTPSGALSIQWFNQYIETKFSLILDRIFKYNEDDCKATMVLKDALVNLKEE